MKKSAKVLSLVLVLALVMATLTACGGIDVSKIKGDWKVSTINDVDTDAFAEAQEADVNLFRGGLTITDKQVTVINAVSSTTFDFEVRANGIEAIQDGVVVLSLAYDENAQTLTMQQDMDGDGAADFKYVYVKGTVEFE